jgi:hypothetical protein
MPEIALDVKGRCMCERNGRKERGRTGVKR